MAFKTVRSGARVGVGTRFGVIVVGLAEAALPKDGGSHWEGVRSGSAAWLELSELSLALAVTLTLKAVSPVLDPLKLYHFRQHMPHTKGKHRKGLAPRCPMAPQSYPNPSLTLIDSGAPLGLAQRLGAFSVCRSRVRTGLWYGVQGQGCGRGLKARVRVLITDL